MILNKEITVLLPVYNGERYLREAIDSILCQTFHDFDLLIINDGSIDLTDEIIKSYSDERIKYISNESNIGLISTLNKGIELITGKYIVRMDADDISLPKRLEKQLEFMNSNPDIAVSGTSIEMFNNEGKMRNIIVNSNPKVLKTELFFESPLMHPTVIIRKSILEESGLCYNIIHSTVEDYGLWINIASKYKISNIPEVQLKYRYNELGISRVAERDKSKRDKVYYEIYRQLFGMINYDATDEDVHLYRTFINGRLFRDEILLHNGVELLKKLKRELIQHDYDLSIFSRKISMYYRYNCVNQKYGLIKSISIYNKYFRELFIFSIIDISKYIVRRYIQGYY